MKNSTFAQKILVVCNHYYNYETFDLDKHSKLLLRMSKTQYAVQIQDALKSIIQTETKNDNLYPYKLLSLINSFLMVGGNIDFIPEILLRELSSSEQMRLNWIKHQLTVKQVCENLLMERIVSHVNQDKISFLDSSIYNILSELILIDIFSDSLLLFYQDEIDEIYQSDEEYFCEVLSKFLRFSFPQSLIYSIIIEQENMVAQIKIKNRRHDLRVGRSKSLIEEIYSGLNRILKLDACSHRFVQIDLYSDAGFLFGDFHHIVQVLSKWMIPYLDDN